MAYTTINKPTLYFNTVTWTGTSSSPTNVTGYGFNPDMIWNKYRAGAGDHQLYDAVRTATKMIIPNSTAAESTNANGVTAFISDGFTAGSDINVNGGNSVAWGWKANGAGVSNTDGTITSTVSANTTAGFSIVKYTGNYSNTATIGHGLGTIPSMVIMKPTSYVGAWWITHKNLSTDNVLEFNTNAEVSYSSFGGGGLRQSQYTSSIITGGPGGGNVSNLWNDNGETYIAYCFAEKTGYSKAGGFNGNGNSDGVFQYCGFKPSFLFLKRSGNTANWLMFDNKREGYNVDNDELYANTNDAEQTYDHIDFLSNGFKIRANSSSINANASAYIWFAIAEAPLVGSNNVPCTAR